MRTFVLLLLALARGISAYATPEDLDPGPAQGKIYSNNSNFLEQFPSGYCTAYLCCGKYPCTCPKVKNACPVCDDAKGENDVINCVAVKEDGPFHYEGF